MKTKILLLSLFLTTALMAQEAPQETKWTFGIGTNFIDNNATFQNRYFSTENWNGGNVFSTITLEYAYDSNWAVGLEGNFTRIDARNLQNGMSINQDKTALSFDLNAKYYFDEHIVDIKNFDAAIVAGLSNYWFDGSAYGAFNAGLALQYFITDNLGFRLQTLGRFAFDDKPTLNNHISHQATLVFKF